MNTETRAVTPQYIPAVCSGFLVCFSVLSRTSTSILTPLWLDSKNNHSSNTDSCDDRVSDDQIDAFSIMFIATFIFTAVCGVALIGIKCFAPHLITDRDKMYNKKQFAMIGVADTVSAVCFLYASSGCRTAPYLQSLAANFAVPVTFVVRFFVLRKRPTGRKIACAALVLFAEFLALLPDIFPSLESKEAKKDQGGADGIAGVLWPMCFFFGFVPLALVSVFMEQAVKPSRHESNNKYTRSQIDENTTPINMTYFLFWTYFFSLLSLVLLFWVDIIPGFGMSDGMLEFAKGFWFNIKCFIGLEGCQGVINVISIICIILLLANRIGNAYFLRFLEGANYLVIINSLQTPLVFLFFTLFDENPVKWHPHAYLSTWLSVAALCIMIPAIYIYDTGPIEIVSSQPEVFTIQDNKDDSIDRSSYIDNDENINITDETSQLIPK